MDKKDIREAENLEYEIDEDESILDEILDYEKYLDEEEYEDSDEFLYRYEQRIKDMLLDEKCKDDAKQRLFKYSERQMICRIGNIIFEMQNSLEAQNELLKDIKTAIEHMDKRTNQYITSRIGRER